MFSVKPAMPLHHQRQAGEDRSDQLFRRLVLSRRCRDVSN